MELQISEIKQSDLEVNFVPEIENEFQETENSLQRTEEWQQERKGNWTGSQFKQIMTCSSKGGRLDWFNKDKVFFFSEGALKYIFANAMERKTGRYIQNDSTKEMKYGTIIEPLIFRRTQEKLQEQNLFLEKTGFKVFDNFQTAGVSSDAVVKNTQGKIIASGEFKACSSWSTLYERTFELTDEKSTDFWQTQGQMLAWNVEENYYVVASPPKDINVYLRAENIMDFYEEWCNETELHFEIIKKSPIHCEALLQRIKISESTVNRFLSENGNLKEILYQEIDFFKNQNVQIPENEIIQTTKEINEIPVVFEEEKIKGSTENQKPNVDVNFDDLPF